MSSTRVSPGLPGVGATATVGGAAGWESAGSPLSGILERIKNILLAPKVEWPVIAAESTSIGQLYRGYVGPLAALAAVLSFVRMSLIGVRLPFGDVFRTPLVTGLTYAVVSFGFGLLGLFLVGLIINALAPTFGGTRNPRQALKTAAYAFTPAWLGSLLSLLPVFSTLLELAAGLYGIYLLYLGLPYLMQNPREKATGYTAAVVVCTILLGIVFGTVSAVTGAFGVGGGLGGMQGSPLTHEQSQARAAATVGNILGGALGTDEKGKAGLTAAIGNLAAAGQKMAQDPNANATAMAAPNPGDGATSTTPDAQNAVAATAGLLTALGGAMSGSRHVDTVDFHVLKDLLPASLPDMRRTDAEGSSQQAMGVKSSSATANYQGSSDAHAQIKLSDLSGVAGLLDAAGTIVQGESSESDAGYEKNTSIGGRSAHEKYDNASRHGELSIMVAKRFGVDVSGDGIDMATLERYAGSVDFARLESMKDAGAKTP